jgi:SPP1 family predicted phage head-tail adaptor
MQAGRLRHRVVIQRLADTTDTQNAYGEEDRVWHDYFWAWAEIDPPKGREFFAAGQKQAQVTTRVRIRYSPSNTVTPVMRVKFGSRILQINVPINPDERNRELILMCTEKV